MASPRVFVSSTFYDLKHIRSSLDVFIESLGYDSILSEKGDIAYSHEIPLDQSCYREVGTADIFVLIIGGRYGSAATQGEGKPETEFFDRYESITKLEHQEAIRRDIPVYILIEAPVYAEYKTYLRNKKTKGIEYAHVDSENVFRFLEEITAQTRNNPIQTFERYADIERWLREQWAGLFRDFLHRTSNQSQLKALTDQVEDLRQVSETLKQYLKAVVEKVSPEDSARLIQDTEEREKQAHIEKAISGTRLFRFLQGAYNVTLDDFIRAVKEASSYEHLMKTLIGDVELRSALCRDGTPVIPDVNSARTVLGLPPFESNIKIPDWVREASRPTSKKPKP